MPDTVDDFMRRFGGTQTIDDREAAQYHDRFTSTHPDDSAFDNRTYHQSATEYLGKLPDDEFQQSARTAIAQAPPQERQSMLGGLLGALGGGGSIGTIANMLGLGSTDPKNMSYEDAARVMN
jgi:predicted lipid-binding transport protein (Tim44 family)